MLPELIIGSRKSSLAKFQSYLIATRIKKIYPEISIQFRFTESQGDRDLSTPLWKMDGKSVFTKDLHRDLLAGNINCIIHSWKDLDLEDRGESIVQSVLEREDSRDVLLFKKSVYHSLIDQNNISDKKIIIATSSPRREWNLGNFLPKFFPKFLQDRPLTFKAIRGNIQTRFRKFMEEDFDALIVAKAAVDRMLEPEILWNFDTSVNLIAEEDRKEFLENKNFLRKCLNQCNFMVLPLSQNPNAPAQGALCVECLKSDLAIQELFKNLEDLSTSLTVNKEREVLSQFGGGCHQKIGVSILERDYGIIQFIRGMSDAGVDLEQRKIFPQSILINKISSYKQENLNKKYKSTDVWPPNRKMVERERETIEITIPTNKDIFVTRSNSLPKNFILEESNQSMTSHSHVSNTRVIWTAGLKTWKDLADQNIWVHGSFDSLGENESINLENLLGRPLDFVKLTHDTENTVTQGTKYPILATYKVSSPIVPETFDASKVKAAFWRSTTEFDALVSRYPELLNVDHFSGPGSTYQTLKKKNLNPKVYLSFNQWLDELVEEEGN